MASASRTRAFQLLSSRTLELLWEEASAGSAVRARRHQIQHLNKDANRSIEAAQVVEELIAMAKQFRAEAEKVEGMGLTAAEVAFYDALANNQSAQDLMGDEVLMKMARELLEKLRGHLSIDWQ